MSAWFTNCSLLIGFLLVVEQVAKLACDLTRPAPKSGGFVVKDSSEGGVSPGLHKRGTPRAEDRGDPRRCRRGHRPPEGILDDVGGCKPPLLPGRLRCGAQRQPCVRDVQGAEQSRGYPRGTERERSPEQPGPKGNAQIPC